MPSPLLVFLDGAPFLSYPPGLEAVQNPWFDLPGLYETLYVRGGKPQNVEKHLERLKNGWLRWRPESFDAAWLSLLQTELDHALHQNGVTHFGRGRFKIFLAPDGRLHRAAEAEPYDSDPRIPPAPARLGIFREAQIPLVATSGFKVMSRGLWHRATKWAQQHGWDDAVMLHEDRIAETSFCNLFLRINDRLLTPPLRDGGLGGLMRALVIDAATSLGMPCAEESFAPEALAQAQEVFITNSIRGVWPVSQVEGIQLPSPTEAWAHRLADYVNAG